MDTPQNVQINLNDYVKSIRSDSKSPFIKLGSLLEKRPTWMKPQFPQESLEKLDESAAQDPWFPSLTKRQRFAGFLGCFATGVLLFTVAGFYIPVLLLRSRKFAILFTFGSCFILLSFGFLRGPYKHLTGLFHPDQLPFTTFYLLSIISTLYCALSVQSVPLTAICGLVQVVALVWYTVSNIPGGQSGLWFFKNMASTVVKKTANAAFSA